MQITKVTYGETQKVGDNYIKAHLEADMFPGEKLEDVVAEMKVEVTEMIFGGSSRRSETLITTGLEPVQEKKTTKKVAKKKATTKKPAATKITKYSRGEGDHKTQFAALLHEISPDWKKSDASKKAAKQLSESLDGTDFIDGDGNILDSFKALITEGMSEGDL